MSENPLTFQEPEQGPEVPGAPGAAAKKPRPQYDIDIFADWCKACGICAAFCPAGCLSLNADGLPVVEPGRRCTGCRWCELHCPDFAIRIRVVKPPRPKPAEED